LTPVIFDLHFVNIESKVKVLIKTMHYLTSTSCIEKKIF